MSNDVWNLVGSDALGLNSNQLVSGFFGLDVLEDESSCSVSKESVVLVGLLEGDDIYLIYDA